MYDIIFNSRQIKYASQNNFSEYGTVIRKTITGKYIVVNDNDGTKEKITKQQVLKIIPF
jgi:hypothetical protein